MLEFGGLTRFDRIRPEHVTPAIDVLLAAARTAVGEAACARPPVSWKTVVEPLDEATDRLARAWGAVAHMNAVVDTPELRAQYNANQPRITAFWTELSQNEALHARFKELAALDEFARWPAARRRLIENELRDFRLGGAELAAEQKQRFRGIRERQSEISTRFAENVLDATNAFALYVTNPAELAGVPDDALQMMRDAAERRRPVRLQGHAAVPELFGGPRLRPRSLAARAALPRLRDACLGSWEPGLEQRPTDGRTRPAAG